MSYQTSFKRSPPFCLLIGQKNTKVFWHQSEVKTATTVWNWSGKTLSPVSQMKHNLFFFQKRRYEYAIKEIVHRWWKTSCAVLVYVFKLSEPLSSNNLLISCSVEAANRRVMFLAVCKDATLHLWLDVALRNHALHNRSCIVQCVIKIIVEAIMTTY